MPDDQTGRLLWDIGILFQQVEAAAQDETLTLAQKHDLHLVGCYAARIREVIGNRQIRDLAKGEKCF